MPLSKRFVQLVSLRRRHSARGVGLRSVFCICIAAAFACSNPYDPVISDPDAFFIDATVEFLQLEGGCWALRVEDDTRYQPIGLEEAFRVDGLDVRAAVKLRPDVGSFCMIGQPVLLTGSDPDSRLAVGAPWTQDSTRHTSVASRPRRGRCR